MAGEDLNLRPSGYETYAVCLTGFYGLTGFVRFVSHLGKWTPSVLTRKTSRDIKI
jgi:hypothetical protein